MNTHHVSCFEKHLPVVALGAAMMVAVGCAPLPPCPRAPDGTLIVANAHDPGFGKNEAGDAPSLGVAQRNAKGSGEERSTRSRDLTSEKELTQEAKAHSKDATTPQPLACRP